MTDAIPSTSSSTASSGASSTASTAKSSTVDYNSFLKLLIQEMKNQDPTSPTDPTQYLSQLASFSGVEQQVSTNSKLDTLLKTSALAQAENMIGLTVTSADKATSGQVTSVALGSNGTAVATLANGKTLPLDNDVTVSVT